MGTSERLTKADTVALWHAVQWMELCVRQGAAADEGHGALLIERERLTAAKRALRKVNAIRRSAPASPQKESVVPANERQEDR